MTRRFIVITLFLLALVSCKNSTLQYELINLRCEYLVNPIGIDAKAPRFTWQIKTEEQEVSQKACLLIVGTDSMQVASGKGDSWESGILRTEVLPVVYKGRSLEPGTRYFWGVKIMSSDGRWSELSKVASFETGLISSNNWKGNWITDTHDYNLKPAPYYRKEFMLKKEVRKARAYIAVAGLYELYLNGKKIGDHCLDPMYTRFDRRNLYVTHDVTDKLLSGNNAVGVLLGNGWYNHQSTAVWYFVRLHGVQDRNFAWI